MASNDEVLIALTEEECWERLGTQRVGRLVTRVQDVVDVFPVNFVVDQRSIVLRTAEGTKFSQMVISREVLFEVDEYTDTHAWSVVVRGVARVLESSEEIHAADQLSLHPMAPTLKRNYVRITPSMVSGRYFEFGDEPSPDSPSLTS